MAAPAEQPRLSPDGFKLGDGYQTLIGIGLDTNIEFFEIEVGIPGMDGGEPVETTTQWNTTWRTFHPRALITLTEFQIVAAYDPCVFSSLVAILNDETAMTIEFPDNSILSFFAYVRMAEHDPLVEGTMPRMTITITPTNIDPSDCQEAAPVMQCAGTC